MPDHQDTILQLVNHIIIQHPSLAPLVEILAANAQGKLVNPPSGRQYPYADPDKLEKASNFIERHREIISDPLNLLINRVPEAGYVDKAGNVILHNGNRVPASGKLAYYSEFSDILILNRGVHEPLEEYCFQQVLSKINSTAPNMIELGAYWAHYSMWLLRKFPQATCYMVEPNGLNIESGINNFRINNYQGEFVKDAVGNSGLQLDAFTSERSIKSLTLLHADIQGYELEMIQGATSFLSSHKVDYIFISTHSEDLHSAVLAMLKELGYRLEVSCGVETETTSCDGFILASSPKLAPVFQSFKPLGRLEIASASALDLVRSIS